jgi:hypothetical protein
MKSLRSVKDTNNLLELLSNLPKGNENNTSKAFDDKPKKKWHGAPNTIKNNGRVNKTKGK